jgi:glycosyltransferase involved in cell wall biosynthesis
MSNSVLVSIVVPFYNEGEGVDLFHQRVSSVLAQASWVDVEFVFVDDGSRDDTLIRLRNLVALDHRVRVVELSRNFGKEAAMTAGIDDAKGDAVILIDADLQDPPELMIDMIKEWQKGVDVVLAQRADRSVDSFFKRTSSKWFYRLHNRVSSTPIPENVGDFRLMDRCVVDALKKLPEQQRFMKGLFAWVGFKSKILPYVREPRQQGASKFSGWRLWNFALDGITGFSTIPLRVWTYVGGVIATVSLMYAIFVLVRTLILGIDIPGYASILISILFLGGIQLLSVGVLGEYIGRMYMESKRRPVYIVRKLHHAEKQEEAHD